MRSIFTNGMLTVAPGAAVSGIARHADTWRVNSGQVWITVEGVADDYWLDAGDTFAVPPGRLIVIEAHGAASSLGLPIDCGANLRRGHGHSENRCLL